MHTQNNDWPIKNQEPFLNVILEAVNAVEQGTPPLSARANLMNVILPDVISGQKKIKILCLMEGVFWDRLLST